MYTKHLSKNSSEEVLLYYLKLILSFHRTFCKMMGLKKYTFILIISKIYVLSLLLYFKNSMLFNFPEAFVFKYCLLLLFQEQKKTCLRFSPILLKACCSTARFALSLLSAYEVPLAVIPGCLVNIYYTDMKQENTFPHFLQTQN